MSAFITSDNHINIIVSYFVDPRADYGLWHKTSAGNYEYLNKENAGAVAETLHAENVRSVNARYDEQQSSDYTFEYLPTVSQYYTVGEIARALDCLEYQSCETDDYHTTEAWELMNNMRKHLLNKIADREGADSWELTEVKGKGVMVEL